MATRQAQPTKPNAGAPMHKSSAAASSAVPRDAVALAQRAWAIARGPYPTLVSRLVLGLVFLLAGIGKVADPAGFMRDIRAYQMLPSAPATVMAYGLPWLEILLAAYLLAGLYLRWAAAITGMLLIVFMVAMGQALARGLTLECGCFGAALGGAALREAVSVGSILRDAALFALAIHLIFVPSIWTVDQRMRGRIRRGAEPARDGIPGPSAAGAVTQAPRTSEFTVRARSMRVHGGRRRR